MSVFASRWTSLNERQTLWQSRENEEHREYYSQTTSTITGFETTDYHKVKELEFGQDFKWVGGRAFQEGRLRISNDGALLFCTVEGGVRLAQTDL
jgi:hypothetical protein